MNNKLYNTFFLAAFVILGLWALYYLPDITVGGVKLRKVDLLSDVRLDKHVIDTTSCDSTFKETFVKPVFVDSCKSGIECIVDFADSTLHGMSHFYEILSEINSLNRPVRIAYFGDSFVEGDILTADLRSLFQKEFGGCGVGYVPVTSKFPGFRPTVKHSFAGWISHNVTDTIGFSRYKQDISNNYFTASEGAYVMLEGTSKYTSNLDICDTSSLFFLTDDSLYVTAQINGRDERIFKIKGDSTLQCVKVGGNISKVRWNIHKFSPDALFYGVTMDGDAGIVLDNFSTRGSSGQQLLGIPYSILKKYDKLRKYDLIILHYGLNVAFEGGTDYTYYKEGMKSVISHLKRAFPETSILIIGIGDRETKDEYGNLRTMPGVKRLIISQQELAAESNVAFWNLYNAMGGEGSIVEMVNSKPPMANYDYTHINFRGGKHIAELLFETLMYGKEQYEKRIMYEK